MKAKEENKSCTSLTTDDFDQDETKDIETASSMSCDHRETKLRSVDDIQTFLGDLEHFLSNYNTNAENEATELEHLYREIQACVANINQIKKQRKAVHKDKKAVRKVLKKLQDEETREMEMSVLTLDKNLQGRWDAVKSCGKIDVLETLLNEIKTQQKALDGLGNIVTRRLGQLQSHLPLKRIKQGTTALPTSSNSTDHALRHGFKRSHNKSTSSSTSSGGTSSFERLHSRRKKTAQNTAKTTSNDMQIVPFPLQQPNSSPSYLQFGNDDLENDDDDLFTFSAAEASSSLGANATFSVAASIPGSEHLQPEVRSMLNALFSELRTSRTILSPPESPGNSPVQSASQSPIRRSNTTTTSTEPASQDIELFYIGN